MTKKNNDFIWLHSVDAAFNTLKSAVAPCTSLSKFAMHANLIVEVDASPVSVGAVLLQQHKKDFPSAISFVSRKLTSC